LLPARIKLSFLLSIEEDNNSATTNDVSSSFREEIAVFWNIVPDTPEKIIERVFEMLIEA
jgi:hypothetical protein